jgi:hypothetical protein
VIIYIKSHSLAGQAFKTVISLRADGDYPGFHKSPNWYVIQQPRAISSEGGPSPTRHITSLLTS